MGETFAHVLLNYAQYLLLVQAWLLLRARQWSGGVWRGTSRCKPSRYLAFGGMIHYTQQPPLSAAESCAMHGTPWRTGVEERSENLTAGKQRETGTAHHRSLHVDGPWPASVYGVQAGDAQVNGLGPFAFVLNLGAMQALSAADLRLS